MKKVQILIYGIIVFTLLLQGCGSRKLPTKNDINCNSQIVPLDLVEFPQDLEVYANKVGSGKRLLDKSQQDKLDASFNSIFFGPWTMSRPSISRNDASIPAKARGYKLNGIPWTQSEWDNMRANADIKSYPSRVHAGITLRNTDLRECPTREMRFAKPTSNIRENPFDYFQYSLLPIGTPLLIAHTSLDGKWHYVECPIAGGWVDAADIGFVDDEFKKKWLGAKFAAIIKDKVNLPGTARNGKDSRGDIGTVLPLVSNEGQKGLNILVPVKGQGGFARIAETNLKSNEAVEKPMPATAGNIARIGNEMMNQPYGWGGMTNERDCSALTRDIFTPFGIWLPRNSGAQAKRGDVISLYGLSPEAKARTIMHNGVPFLSLVGMKGHITLYVGEWKGKPAIFHNVWGLRIVKDGDDNERFVIGRAVVTSITPGIELENLYRPVTFVDRIRTLTNVGTR